MSLLGRFKKTQRDVHFPLQTYVRVDYFQYNTRFKDNTILLLDPFWLSCAYQFCRYAVRRKDCFCDGTLQTHWSSFNIYLRRTHHLSTVNYQVVILLNLTPLTMAISQNSTDLVKNVLKRNHYETLSDGKSISIVAR